MADDLNPVGLSRDQLQLVTDPSSLSNSEREEVKRKISEANANIRSYLLQNNPILAGVNGDVTFYYRDGSVDVIDAENVITYEPERKSIFSENGNTNKEAVITIARGQNYSIGPNLRKYFSLSNGSIYLIEISPLYQLLDLYLHRVKLVDSMLEIITIELMLKTLIIRLNKNLI